MREEDAIPSGFRPLGDSESLREQVFMLCETMNQSWDVVIKMPTNWRWDMIKRKCELEEKRAQKHREAMNRARARRR